jgi:hypothetical protein
MESIAYDLIKEEGLKEGLEKGLLGDAKEMGLDDLARRLR